MRMEHVKSLSSRQHPSRCALSANHPHPTVFILTVVTRVSISESGAQTSACHRYSNSWGNLNLNTNPSQTSYMFLL